MTGKAKQVPNYLSKTTSTPTTVRRTNYVDNVTSSVTTINDNNNINNNNNNNNYTSNSSSIDNNNNNRNRNIDINSQLDEELEITKELLLKFNLPINTKFIKVLKNCMRPYGNVSAFKESIKTEAGEKRLNAYIAATCAASIATSKSNYSFQQNSK